SRYVLRPRTMPINSSSAMAPRKTGVARTMIWAGVIAVNDRAAYALDVADRCPSPKALSRLPAAQRWPSAIPSVDQLTPARAANLVGVERRWRRLARLHAGVAADDDLSQVAVGGHDRRHTDHQERPEVRAHRGAVGRGAGADADLVQP